MNKILMIFLFLLLYSEQNHAAQPGFPCDPTKSTLNPSWEITYCWGQPYTKYVRDDALFPYPSAIIQKRNGSTHGQVFAQFDGWGFTEINESGDQNSDITIQQVYSHYSPTDPRLQWPLTFSNHKDLDWGGVLHGKNANGERLASTLDEIAARGYAVDILALGGNCYGGNAVIIQSIIMPERWQQKITSVFALLPGMPSDQPWGVYATGRAAWDYADGTKYEVESTRPVNNIPKIKNIYYRIQANSPITDNVGFDPYFLPNVCDAGHVYCYAHWTDQGHQWPDQKSSPAYQAIQNAPFAGNDMVIKNGTMKIIPTNSSANYFNLLRGHWNQGISWNSNAVVDSTSQLVIPIRYTRVTDMGLGLPDQPTVATVDWHFRPVNMQLPIYTLLNWTYQNQSGQAIVTTAGEVTIIGLVLTSDTVYSNLTLTNQGIMPGC